MKTMITIAMMLICYTAAAQSFPVYCVYLVRGDVKVNDARGVQKQLVQKASLFDTNTVVIGMNSELQLINKDGKFLRVTVPGTYLVKRMAMGFRENKAPGITPTYFQMIYHEILDPHYDVSQIKRNSVGAAYGAATRGLEYLVYPVDFLRTSVDSIYFIWRKANNTAGYTLNIYDEQKAVIYSLKTKDTQQVIALQHLKNKGNFSWGIKEFNNLPDYGTFKFEWLSAEEEQKEINAFNKPASGDPLKDKLDFIDDLESNAFIEKAKTAFRKLLQENNDNKALANTYYIFLVRYGFDDEAKDILNSARKK